jgi:hypothetical protein
MSKNPELRKRFKKAMEPFSKVYTKKYTYNYDFGYNVNRMIEGLKQFIDNTISDYAIWLKFINPKYTKKPSEDTENLEHLRSYYCYKRLEYLKIIHEEYLNECRDEIAKILKCKSDKIIDIMEAIADKYTENEAFKRIDNIVLAISTKKCDIHSGIYDFLY